MALRPDLHGGGGALGGNATDCPDAEVALAFAQGRLAGDLFAGVEAHIDRCDDCRRCISELARGSGETTSLEGVGATRDEATIVVGPAPTASPAVWVPRGDAIGRYVIDGLLGAGGMGVVYAAYDTKLGRKVALKLLRAAPGEGPEASERLFREARAMARLAHPNVVAVYDVDVQGGQLFLAMEFVEGITLRSWLRREARSAREVLRACVQAGRGLSAAHAVGVVHRDVKPDNVLVDARGRVRVTDFGLASTAPAPPRDEAPGGGDEAPGAPDASAAPPGEPAIAARLGAPAGATRTGVFAGTPAYMAPEQCRGRAADAKSDQFSFCVMLYEALYHERPFKGETLLALADAAARGELREPGAVSGVPPRVRKALLRGLRADPAARFASMDELLDALSDAPGARRRAAALGAAALVALGLVYRQVRPGPPPACAGVEQKIALAWGPGRKAAVRDGLLGTGKPFAADALRGVERALDKYAGEWAAARKDACEATQVRGEQSAELLDLRMACLDGRLHEVEALTEVFARADADVAAKAAAAAQALTPLAPCADAKALRARVRPPADAAAAARVEALRGDLARAKALSDAGKYREALPLADRAVGEAEALGYGPTLAEALVRQGVARTRVGDAKGASAALRRAASVADAAGDDETRAEALVLLFFVSARVLQDNDELAAVLNEQAEASIARLGGSPRLDGRRRTYLASALRGADKLDEARREIQTALPLLEAAFGADSLEVSQGLTVLGDVYVGLESYDEAVAVFRRNVEASERARGREHPETAVLLDGLGRAFVHQLRFAEALPYFERALAIQDAAVGPESMRSATYAQDVGSALAEVGQHARALPYLRRALALYEAQLGPKSPRTALTLSTLGEAHLALGERQKALEYLERGARLQPNAENKTVLAQAQFALARALSASGRDRRRARTLALAARDAYRGLKADPLDERTVDQIERWLAGHPRG